MTKDLSINLLSKVPSLSQLEGFVQFIWQSQSNVTDQLKKAQSCLGLYTKNAEVVKLANTLRSGRSGRKLLRVQLPSSACLNHKLAEMLWVSAKGVPTPGGLVLSNNFEHLPSDSAPP